MIDKRKYNPKESVTSQLSDEAIHYDKNVLARLIMKFAPDWRRILNEIQRHSQTGSIEILTLEVVEK